MKKFIKKSVVLLMAGVMVIMPATMSAQAKEGNNTKNEAVSVLSRNFSYTHTAYTTAAVNLRSKATAYDDKYIILTIPKGAHVKIDYNNAFQSEGHWWFACQYNGHNGYVVASYIKLIPGNSN